MEDLVNNEVANGVNAVIQHDVDAVSERITALCARLEDRTILITGAAGFLCAYMVDFIATLNRKYLKKPLRVIALDNYQCGIPERLQHYKNSSTISLREVDVSSAFVLHESIDFVVHGASIASPTYYRQYPLQTIDANVSGVRNTLELARSNVQSMVYLSSSEIYGDPDPQHIPTPESYRGSVSCTGPRACYDESKRLGETLCVVYHSQYGVPVKIIRPFNVYGPGQRLDDQRIVPDIMQSLVRHKPLTLLSDGQATRSFCYASDFIVGMLLVLLKGTDAQPYNIGNNEECSIRELADIASKLAVPKLKVIQRESDDKHYLVDNPQRRCPDISKAKSLGFVPAVNLREGLRRTYQSYDSAHREACAL